jgi:predicted Rossmann-fold nucleotide-binding protein
LLQWVDKAVESGFIAKSNSRIIIEPKEVDDVVAELKGY